MPNVLEVAIAEKSAVQEFQDARFFLAHLFSEGVKSQAPNFSETRKQETNLENAVAEGNFRVVRLQSEIMLKEHSVFVRQKRVF